MTSVIIPQKSLVDLIDEELYTIPNSPILNHSSPVYNPIFNSNHFNFNNYNVPQTPEPVMDSNLKSVSPAQVSPQSVSPQEISPSQVSPQMSLSLPASASPEPVKPASLFDFSSLNSSENRQKIFNDYSNPNQSFIQPSRLVRNDEAQPVAMQTKSHKMVLDSFKPRNRAKTMKIKTLPPAEKFNDLFDPDTKPSSSIDFDFLNDNDSIFVHHNNSGNLIKESKENDESDVTTRIVDFQDYDMDQDFDEFDDMSDYESDDDNLFDFYDDNDQFYGNTTDVIMNNNEFNGEYHPETAPVGVKLEDLNDQLSIDQLEDEEESKPESQTEEIELDDMVMDQDDEMEEEKSHESPHVKHKKKHDEMNDHYCNLINPTTGVPCDKQFSRPYDLIRHQETIHATKKKIFRCVLCEGRVNGGNGNGKSKTFSRGDALSRHIKVKHQLVGQEALDMINKAKENVEYVLVA